MASSVRRAGAQILALLSSSADPGADSSVAQWYAKLVAGVGQFFTMDGGGLRVQTTPAINSVAARIAYYLEDFLSTVNIQTTNAGGSTSSNNASQGNPGFLRQSVTSAGTTATHSCPASMSAAPNLIVGSGTLAFEGCVRTTTAQDGAQQFVDRFGMGDTVTGDQANGVYFESDRATNGDNDYRICCANGGVRTKTTTGVAPTAGAFERWRFVINSAATSVQAYMNDTAVGAAVATNIPTANPLLAWFVQLAKTLGATARTIDRDYCEMYQVLSR